MTLRPIQLLQPINYSENDEQDEKNRTITTKEPGSKKMEIPRTRCPTPTHNRAGKWWLGEAIAPTLKDLATSDEPVLQEAGNISLEECDD